MNITERVGTTEQGWPVYLDSEPDLYHIREDADRVQESKEQGGKSWQKKDR